MGNKKAGEGEVTGADYENGKFFYKTLEHLATDIIRYIMLYTNEIGRYVLDRYLGCPHLERIPNGTWGENWGSCPVCHLRWQYWDNIPLS